jgi:hypothetical protein
MKKLILFMLIIALFVSCKNKINETEREKILKQDSIELMKKVNSRKDTSLYFIKKILNASPQEVEKYLGKTDNGIVSTDDCGDQLKYCNEALYQNGKYDIVYYNNKMKGVIMKNFPVFDNTAIELIGFGASEPTVKNGVLIIWRSDAIKTVQYKSNKNGPNITIKGIRQIQVCSNNGKIILSIDIDVDYNDKY